MWDRKSAWSWRFDAAWSWAFKGVEMTQNMPSSTQPDAELAAENQALRARMAYLLEQAERNHDIMCRHQAFDLEIVGASTFPELIGTIFRTLPIISELDGVTLSLLDEDDDIVLVMEKLGVDFNLFPDLMFVDDAAALGFSASAIAELVPQPQLGSYDTERHGALFFGAVATLRSVALVPLLRNKRLIGSLNLASADAARFTPNMGTDFVRHMASIIAICLENVISNEMLKYIGLTDSLTGVYNRRYIDRRLLDEIARARRQQYAISCMYIDIDHFKRVNDSAGHQGGDEVLREVAARIRQELRRSDALGRFGGEEFVVLLIDAELGSAVQVAERIRASIADRPFDLSSALQVSISVSIGVASLENTINVIGDASDMTPVDDVARALIGRADHALYQAKDQGRNRVISLAG